MIVDTPSPRQHHAAQNVARPRRTASPSAAWAGGWTSASTIKLIAMLALGVRGLVVVVDGLPRAWRPLLEALLLALLALAFIAAAAQSSARRFGWLLSASTAAGLAIAAGYRFASTAPLATTAVVAIFALSLIAAYGVWRAR